MVKPKNSHPTFFGRLCLVILSLLFSSILIAGNTGKISGTVKDSKTNEPLIGANVIIEGTSMGASTDLEGNYTILNVPPGEYVIVSSMVGYTPTRITGIRVRIDLTTVIDISMSETVMQLGNEVVITAERPLVQKDQTATTAIVGREQLASLPVTEFSQALNLQAGFVAGSLRGGRRGEVAYWIDGVPVTDVYDGSQVVEVNKSLIQEAQLVSGAFNAEYGQAMSGIVNIATREGGKNYNIGIGTYIGQYYTTDTAFFPGLDDFRSLAIHNIEGNISGPILGEDLTFFLNGRYIYFDGYLNGYRRFKPHNIGFTDSLSNYHLSRDADGKGDSSRVSMNWSERIYGQGKITYRISSLVKLNYNFIYDDNTFKNYNKMYFYNPDGNGNTYSKSQTHILQLTHTLSQNAFYTIGASVFKRRLESYLYENPNDPRYVHPKLFEQPDPYSFYTGGTDLGRYDRSTTTMLIKADLSWQFNQQNLVKFGIEARQHQLTVESIQLQPIEAQADIKLSKDSPFIKTRILDVSTTSHDKYERKPNELSIYIQDKMEFKDIILNLGIRADYFNPDGTILNDESDPNIYNPIKPSNRFFDYNENGEQDLGEPSKTVEQRRTYWYKKASSKFQISPRFGASFPITDRGVVHFSYGYFFQIPRFERLYENPNFKIGQGTGNQGVVGNSDLKPEQTIKGEIGVQQGISEDITLDLTAYFQDIRNLTSTRADEIIVFGGSSKYNKYVNADFGFVKGVALSIDKRFATGFAASLYYTYQVARGSASDPNESRNAVAGGSLPEVQLTPLGWDQRHTLNTTIAYNGPGYGISVICQYGSGTPYTPRRTIDVSSPLTNGELKPQFFSIDMRAFYEVAILNYRFILFTRVFNLLDTRNEVGVFYDTGRAGFTLDEERTRSINPAEYVNSITQYYRTPTNFSEPRRIEVGFNVEF